MLTRGKAGPRTRWPGKPPRRCPRTPRAAGAALSSRGLLRRAARYPGGLRAGQRAGRRMSGPRPPPPGASPPPQTRAARRRRPRAPETPVRSGPAGPGPVSPRPGPGAGAAPGHARRRAADPALAPPDRRAPPPRGPLHGGGRPRHRAGAGAAGRHRGRDAGGGAGRHRAARTAGRGPDGAHALAALLIRAGQARVRGNPGGGRGAAAGTGPGRRGRQARPGPGADHHCRSCRRPRPTC